MATRINLTANPKYQRNGTKSYAHLLRKYRFSPTQDGPFFHGKQLVQQGRYIPFTKISIGCKTRVISVLQKKEAGQVGEIDIDDIQNDSMYLATVGIGTPAQSLNLDFDTGSADLWVWSTGLPSTTLSQASGHTVFDPSKSSTFKKSSISTWNISYGDGSSAFGEVGTDNVNVGDLVIKAQAIEVARGLSAQFASNTGDGLLGLAFGNINTVKPRRAKTPVENMIAQNHIPKSARLFTAHLGSSKEPEDQSFYTFGFIDEPTVQALGQQITYTPIDSRSGFWLFSSTSVTINGQPVSRAGNTAIADTGTTLALVDDSTCEGIYAAIPGACYDVSSQGYIFPSDTNICDLPTITFAVGNTQFAIHKDALGFAEAKPGYVYGGIQSRGDLAFDIMGDTFLKGIYAIFDIGNLRFGAVQRPDPSSNQNLN